MKQTKTEDDGRESRDRLSELPDPIILEILSCLSSTQEKARTELISKSWRGIWHSLPTVSFDEKWFLDRTGSDGRTSCYWMEFENLVDGIMKSLHEDKLKIAKFDIKLRMPGGVDRQYLVNHWMKIAMHCSVEEVSFRNTPFWPHSLPVSILGGNSLRSLTISSVKLLGIGSASLPCLKRLCLSRVRVKGKVLQFIISKCPTLEELYLRKVIGVKRLQIAKHLKYMHIKVCPDPDSMSEVDAPMVEKLSLENSGYFGRPSVNTSLPNLRILRVLQFSNYGFLCELIPRLPMLEVLRLWIGPELKRLEFRSSSIKDIQLEYESHLKAIRIDVVPEWYQREGLSTRSGRKLHLHYYEPDGQFFPQRTAINKRFMPRIINGQVFPYAMVFPREVIQEKSKCWTASDFKRRDHYFKCVVTSGETIPDYCDVNPLEHSDNVNLKFDWGVSGD